MVQVLANYKLMVEVFAIAKCMVQVLVNWFYELVYVGIRLCLDYVLVRISVH